MDSITIELLAKSKELQKQRASEITSKAGTSIDSARYRAIAGLNMVEGLQNNATQKCNENNERYSVKVANELNAPIKAELSDAIKKIKDICSQHINNVVDSHIQQLNTFKMIPLTAKMRDQFETLKMLMEYGKVSADDIKLWNNEFVGHYQAEQLFSAMAEKHGFDVIPSIDSETSRERLEQFRSMALNAISHFDNPNDNILSMSFFSDNPNSPIAQLISDIDSDIAVIIPAERRTVVDRLKEAEKNALETDNVMLSAKIRSFRERNLNELSTPEELKDSLYEQAEEFITRGMSAKKGDE